MLTLTSYLVYILVYVTEIPTNVKLALPHTPNHTNRCKNKSTCCEITRICSSSLRKFGLLLWSTIYLFSKFYEYPPLIFWVILLTKNMGQTLALPIRGRSNKVAGRDWQTGCWRMDEADRRRSWRWLAAVQAATARHLSVWQCTVAHVNCQSLRLSCVAEWPRALPANTTNIELHSFNTAAN